MDPLSIATGAASLAISAGTISVALYTLIDNIKKADTTLASLANEVNYLQGNLAAVDETVRRCQSQSLTLAHLDNDMWTQINFTLTDCKMSLQGLNNLLDGIKNSAPKSFWKKPNLHFKLSLHADDITQFMNKINRSNCAMQTSLTVMNISLSFRTNISQDMIFQQLLSLQGLVERSFYLAHCQPSSADPVSNKISTNLYGLAKAARKFHSSASSTASSLGGAPQRDSFGWGSDAGRLPTHKREMIERWNASQLNMVPEVPEESTVLSVTDETLQTESIPVDQSTTITTPDVGGKGQEGEVVQEPREEPHIDGSDESDDSDDSDFEMDFLKNFEELAMESFHRKDYTKAEQFLRRAIERSTGDASNSADFKSLKLRLAVCCSLQAKWESAAGSIESMSKLKNPSNLPVFHLLHAISLAHLEGDRFEDAYNVCKKALQGKKKILGKESRDFNECLALFATICEKRGDRLEAEAVRHSMPPAWRGIRLEAYGGAKNYVLQNTQLIEASFGTAPPNSDPGRPPPSFTTIPQQPAGSSNANSGGVSPRPTEIPHLHINVRDGLFRPRIEELSGRQLGELDTGKEVCGVAHVESVPRPQTRVEIPKAVRDEYSGKQLGEFDTGKEMLVQKAGAKPPGSGTTQTFLASSQPKSSPGQGSPPTSGYPSSNGQGAEPEVKPNDLRGKSSQKRSAASPAAGLQIPMLTSEGSSISWNHSAESLKSYLQHIDKNRFDLPVIPAKTPSGFIIGINFGVDHASIAAFIAKSLGGDETQIWNANVPLSPNPATAMDGLQWLKCLRPSLLPSELKLPIWECPSWNLLQLLARTRPDLIEGAMISIKCASDVQETSLLRDISRCVANLETFVADEVTRVHGKAFLAWTNLDGVVVSVPNALFQDSLDIPSILTRGNGFGLLRYARIIPQSIAVILHHFYGPNRPHIPSWQARTIVVLHCGDVLVERTAYRMMFDGKKVNFSQLSTETDLCGSMHAELEFLNMVQNKVSFITQRFHTKLASGVMEKITSACCRRFHQLLPTVGSDVEAFEVEIDVPSGFPGLENRRLKFMPEEILACLEPSVKRIQEMLLDAVLKHHDPAHPISHILLAGSYTASETLVSRLRAGVGRLTGLSIQVLQSDDPVFAAAKGGQWDSSVR